VLPRCFSSVDDKEIDNFNRYGDWWQESNSMKPLFAYNKLRVRFIREFLLKDQSSLQPQQYLNSLHALDVGSGGGLLSESLGRVGCQVLGIDPSENSIKVAKNHLCNDLELVERVNYKQATIEELVKQEKYQNRFDFAASMEVVEHVNNQKDFVKNIVKAVKPDGLIFMSTISRTLEAWLLTIKMSEDVLGIIPQGTHDWDKYLNPEELHEMLESSGCRVIKTQGAAYDPVTNQMFNWPFSNINYMMVAKKL
jgi:ubiquinone biosynthesis O-methyltransferase